MSNATSRIKFNEFDFSEYRPINLQIYIHAKIQIQVMQLF